MKDKVKPSASAYVIREYYSLQIVDQRLNVSFFKCIGDVMALFIVALVFSFYSLGANAVEGFMNYPSWRHIPETSFQVFHKHLDRSVPVWVVLPTLVSTVATALLIFFGPETLPRELVVGALVLQLIGWAASFAVAIPVQISLSKDGWSAAKVARLMLTDRWFRQLPSLLSAGIYVVLLWRALTL